MNDRSAKKCAKKALKTVNRRYSTLPSEVRKQVWKAAKAGASYRQIVATFDVSMGTVCRVINSMGGSAAAIWEPGSNSLTIQDRFAIDAGLKAGLSKCRIANRLGRHRSTVTREVNCRSVDGVYDPVAAHQQAYDAARRVKPTRLGSNPALLAEVERRLGLFHSPQQIAARLRLDFPDDPAMRISHETVYKTLYLQCRGELKREVLRCLRSGRTARKNRDRSPHPGPILNPILLKDRPAEADDRQVPGHWEGDLILGAFNRSAIATLVERMTRLCVLILLPMRHDAVTTCEALVAAFNAMPPSLVKSLTWDRGSEMANHADFAEGSGITVYFCDPHSPWQRPSNENFNGLLRQYFPKGTDLSKVTNERLLEVQEELNNRPRAVLQFRTPNEAYADLVAQQT